MQGVQYSRRCWLSGECGEEVVLVGGAAGFSAGSTAGRPQLRGLTETGEPRTPRNAVRPKMGDGVSLECQCAIDAAGKLIRECTEIDLAARRDGANCSNGGSRMIRRRGGGKGLR